jgi:tRNA-modifying protein YgfZ
VTPRVEIAAPSAEEMTAMRQGAAWAPRAGDRLDLAGADRVRFLHNLVTCDVRELAAGRAARGFVTSVKGGVLADADVVALDDRFRLVLPAGRGPAIRSHLERYRIAERVEIAERADLAAFVLRGARAAELLATLAVPQLEPNERCDAAIEGVRFAVRREARGREPRFELEVAAADREQFVVALGRAGEPNGLTAVPPAAIELARIEDGELAWGVDYGEENFPQETGEGAAVSYSKGCYLGQEVVARIHYRGAVQRVPCRLLAEPGAAPAPGSELLFEGRAVGRLTSVAIVPRGGRRIGLALVHRRAADTGLLLTTAAGERLEVMSAEPG